MDSKRHQSEPVIRCAHLAALGGLHHGLAELTRSTVAPRSGERAYQPDPAGSSNGYFQYQSDSERGFHKQTEKQLEYT